MALTRKALKAMGLTEEQVDSIIEAHTETVDGLKEQIKTYEADAKKLSAVQKQLDDLKTGDGKDYKTLYEQEKQAHAKTKSDAAAKETAATAARLFRAELEAVGIAGDTPINKIALYATSSGTFPAGTVIEVFGVSAAG